MRYSQEQLDQMPEAARRIAEAEMTAEAQPPVPPPPVTPPPVAQPVVAAPPAPVPVDTAALQRETDAKFGRLGQQLQQLNAELQARDAKILELETRPPTPTAPPPSPDAPITRERLVALYGEECVSQVGEDTCRMIAEGTRKLAHEVAPVAPVDVEQVVARKVSEFEARSAAQRSQSEFMGRVEALAPGATAINEQAKVNGFAAFLDTPYPGRGSQTYRQAAEIAARNADAAGLAEVFNAFFKPTVVVQPPPPLAAQVVPGIGREQTPAPAGTVAPIKRSVYLAWIQDMRLNPTKYTAAECADIQQQYATASAQGRVINDV